MNDQAYAVLEVVDESDAVLVRFEEPEKATTPLDSTARALTRTVRQMQRRMRQGENWKGEHPEDAAIEIPEEQDLFVLVERLILTMNEEQLVEALKRAKKAYIEVKKLDSEGRLTNLKQAPNYPPPGFMFRRPF